MFGLYPDQARPRRAESAEIRESPRRIPAAARKRFYHSRRSRPVFQGAWHYQAARPAKRCRAEIEQLIVQEDPPDITTYHGQNASGSQELADSQTEYRPDFTPGRTAASRKEQNHER